MQEDPTILEKDKRFMKRALELAEEAADASEVPVGAVIVLDGEIVGEGSNAPIGSCDPTAHAEIRAIRDACKRLGNYRVPGATLYVTIEPCTMCVGAIVHARVARVVFGAREPKAGAVVSQNTLFEHPAMNTQVDYAEGVCAAECSRVMSDFFDLRRKKKKALKQSLNSQSEN
jgi:tRNA(adenine34) deaminase